MFAAKGKEGDGFVNYYEWHLDGREGMSSDPFFEMSSMIIKNCHGQKGSIAHDRLHYIDNTFVRLFLQRRNSVNILSIAFLVLKHFVHPS